VILVVFMVSDDSHALLQVSAGPEESDRAYYPILIVPGMLHAWLLTTRTVPIKAAQSF
jgi:hypothetical protein